MYEPCAGLRMICLWLTSHPLTSRGLIFWQVIQAPPVFPHYSLGCCPVKSMASLMDIDFEDPGWHFNRGALLILHPGRVSVQEGERTLEVKCFWVTHNQGRCLVNWCNQHFACIPFTPNACFPVRLQLSVVSPALRMMNEPNILFNLFLGSAEVAVSWVPGENWLWHFKHRF